MKTLALTLSHPYPVQIAVISDTHTSGQQPDFHPLLIPRLTNLKPDFIFHAGDITLPESLVCLQEIAPTYAVRGNRDLFGFANLPGVLQITIGEQKILMAHGHGPLIHYLMDKAQYMVNGYRFERYKQYLESENSAATIYIFGHTHIPVHQWTDGKLYMNPGTSGYPTRGYPHPTIGWIRIQVDGSIQSEIQYLEHPDQLFPKFG